MVYVTKNGVSLLLAGTGIYSTVIGPPIYDIGAYRADISSQVNSCGVYLPSLNLLIACD